MTPPLTFIFWITSALSILLLDGCDAFSPAFAPATRYVGLPKVEPLRSKPIDRSLVRDVTKHFPSGENNVVLFLQGEGDSTSSGMTSPLDRPVLALVDFVSLIIFAAVGKASHNPDGSLDIAAVLVTALPFLMSWFLTSPLTGVYSEDNKDGNVAFEAFVKSAKGWALAMPLGIVLRGFIKGYVPPTSFIIVSLISTLVIVGGARVLFAFAEDVFVEMVN